MVTSSIIELVDSAHVTSFPYAPVISEFHRVGKHFVNPDLLASLARARDSANQHDENHSEASSLRDFLDFALDKYDGRYHYPSYLAIKLLRNVAELPPNAALPARDQQFVLLICDVLDFELKTLDGAVTLFPGMQPTPETVAKRCRLALHAAVPAIHRLGVDFHQRPDDLNSAREFIAAANELFDVADRHALTRTMLPVYTLHDEYMFIRILQSFETTFGLQVAQLREVISALEKPTVDVETAVGALTRAAAIMQEAAPLFSLLATMQVAAFREFRQYTEGASAIQSEGYKTVESLCRRPDPERLDSLAYHSVAKVRSHILAGQPNVYETFLGAIAEQRIEAQHQEQVRAAMDAMEDVHRRWRKTHYSVAMRMLGDNTTGTGYSEGTPYLKSVIDNKLFTPKAPRETPRAE